MSKKKTPAPTLGGQKLKLQPGNSHMVRYEIGALGASSWPRATAAALAFCIRNPLALRPKASLEACHHNVSVYGQRYFDQLIERGITPAEIVRAGADAYVLCVEGLPSNDEVDAAEDFSEAGEE